MKANKKIKRLTPGCGIGFVGAQAGGWGVVSFA